MNSIENTLRLAIASAAEPGWINLPAAKRALEQAAQVLRSGGTVAFPTETVYGLGANALEAEAVAKIFLAKGRPAWDPLIVHVSDIAMLQRVAADVPARAQKLMDAFWPGPLTLLLPKLAAIPDAVTAGRPLVAIRMPSHPVALALIAAANVPVAAPSANRFGHTSPTTAQHVLDDLDGRIDLVLDGGPTWCGLESTVIEVGEQSVILYRPGAIPVEEIERIAGPVVLYEQRENSNSPQSLPSPGVGIRHYAPVAQLIPVDVGEGPEPSQQARWLRAISAGQPASLHAGALLPSNWPLPPGFEGVRHDWGSWKNDRELARRLFAGLRALDAMGVQTIFCPLPPSVGLGRAIQDRLLKAARTS